MAISARRFRFLDQETNLPTQDLLSLKDNQVYNNIAAQISTSLTSIKDASGVLGYLNGSLGQLNSKLSGVLGNSLGSKVTGIVGGELSKLSGELDKAANGLIAQGASALSSELQSTVNGIVGKLGDIKMPAALSGALTSLKSVNLDGVQDFYKDALKIGGPVLSQGGDLLKTATTGLKVTDNMLTGLTGSLSLSMADQIGDISDQLEFKLIGNIAKLEKLMPDSLGVSVNPSNVYDKFTSFCSAQAQAFSTLPATPSLGSDALLSLMETGNTSEAFDNIRACEMDYFQKQDLLAKLDEAILSVPETDPKFSVYLEAKAQVKKIPFISEERRDVNLQYSNLSDQIGSMSTSLLTVNLGEVDRFSFTEEQNSVFSKVQTYQNQVKNNTDLCTRDNTTGSYSDVDFSAILPVLTPQELATVKYAEPSTAHRVLDLHPTVEVFLGDDHGFTTA